MSDEMNKNQGRQTQDKAAKANGPTTPKQSLLNRKHRTPLQNLVLSSMADGDLFATLFNLYFYCMSECTDEVGYAWYSEDFSRAVERKEYDFLYKTDVTYNDDEGDKSFIGSFDSLKKAAFDYYERADDMQRNQFHAFMRRIGWKFGDVVGRYHNIVKETIIFYEQELSGYLDLFGEFYFSDRLDNDCLGTLSVLAGKHIHPYKIHRLAYWYCAISESIDKGWANYWWWDHCAMTGKELFDFLSETGKTQEICLEKTRDATLDLIDRALKYMRPINCRTSKIQTI